MPSPFPGMDPYLEAPDIFPDLHHTLAAMIRDELNHILPPTYYARMEMRPELGILADDDDEEPRRWIIPDVLVLKHQPPREAPRPARDAGGGPAVAEAATRAESGAVDLATLPDEPARHYFVEIRDSKHNHELITLVEILSPANKRPGPDRKAYAAKQREVLESRANLVEVDLLRNGRRVLPSLQLEQAIDRFTPPPDYVVLVSRSWMRVEPTWGYRVYPFTLRDWLPCIGVPLREEEPAVLLDLQQAFHRAYDGGPYRRGAVDYTKPPDPPLSGEDAAWAAALLREHGLVPPGA